MSEHQKLANSYFKTFAAYEGSQHIANPYALKKILDLIKINKPSKILEVGLGIGCIAYTVIDQLKTKKREFVYYGTEANEFCLNALPKNMKGHYSDLKIFHGLDDINHDHKFDFVLIDGQDDTLAKVSDLITEHAVIFIEGDRKSQESLLYNLFPKAKLTHIVSNFKNPPGTHLNPNDWSGGGKLIYVNPTTRQKINHWTERMRTSFNNRVYRKLVKS